MTSTSALFYVFSAVLLAASFRVITARSTVQCGALPRARVFQRLLRLDDAVGGVSGDRGSVLVYVGAGDGALPLVVMMLDINTDAFREGFWKHFPLAGTVGAVIALEMALVLLRGLRPDAGGPSCRPRRSRWATRACWASRSYTNYLYPLQIAALVLLVAIVAAIALTLRGRKDSKHQDASLQVRARKADRVSPRQDAAGDRCAPQRRSAAICRKAGPPDARAAISLGHYYPLGGILFGCPGRPASLLNRAT